MQLFKIFFHDTIRLGQTLSLIFFVLCCGCNNDNATTLTIIWDDNKAISLDIPQNMVHGEGKVPGSIDVRLKGGTVSIIGKLTEDGNNFRFTPAVPFTAGLDYEVYHDGSKIGDIIISKEHQQTPASVVAIFPSADTLPENLLKIYIAFNSPMREGDALQYIYLLDEQGDTLTNIFLDLQSELWNEERSVLTVWLDPGRIKRDLIPNQKMGSPLKAGKRYSIRVSADWKDAQDLAIGKPFIKSFYVGARDGAAPDPANWNVQLPVSGSQQALKISFGESLDHYLLGETIKILDNDGTIVNGEFVVGGEEISLEFRPASVWKSGIFKLQVENHLEDLAGNNLSGLFDRDMKLKEKKVGRNVVREFEVR